MDFDKLFDKAMKKAEDILDKIDTPDSTSVWAQSTRVGGSKVGEVKHQPVKFSRSELEFVFDAAEDNGNPLIVKTVKAIREKYGL